MIKQSVFLSSLFLFLTACPIFDNRYFPLYRRFNLKTEEKQSWLNSNFYFLTSDEARDSINKKIGIPELWGKFDQIKVSAALPIIGKTNPLDPQFRTLKELVWDWDGKISAQGFHLDFERPIHCNFSVGAAFDLMHVQSRNEFIISSEIKTDLMKMSPGKTIQLEQERRQINQELGLSAGMWSRTGLSDLDIYIKYNWLKEYYWKCRRVDASIWFGTLVPTSVKTDLDNPASIPFGGDGLTGLYLSGALNLELKEDVVFGVSMAFLKRVPRTLEKRMPVNDEPLQYGAVKGLARVNQGFTFGFSAFLEILEYWNSTGLRAGYNLVVHGKDKWTDKRADKTIAVKLAEVEKRSDWIAEYIRLGFVYDLSAIKKFKKFEPSLYLDVDVPAHFFWARDICRATRVSVGIEASF